MALIIRTEINTKQSNGALIGEAPIACILEQKPSRSFGKGAKLRKC